jgi:hypothetical protein
VFASVALPGLPEVLLVVAILILYAAFKVFVSR